MDSELKSVGDLVGAFWPIAACALIVSLLATPLCRRFALRRGLVDVPDAGLKPHERPVAYFGGVAIFLGWAAGLILAVVMYGGPDEASSADPQPPVDLSMTLGIFGAGLAVMLLGLFDDLRMVSPVVKLTGIAGATFLLIMVGIGDDTITILVRSTSIELGPQDRWLVLVYSIPLTLIITTGAANATNLIDGLDGLCSGVLGIIAVGYLVLAGHLYLYRSGIVETQLVILSLAMLGAALGFLPYNRNPATIFMGDAGSMLLGLNAAIILLLFAKSNASRWMFASVMVFGLPLADMLLTLARRWRNQKPLMQGDRSHFYDQLVDRGVPVPKVVGISYALAIGFALLGCMAIFVRTRYLLLLYGLAGGGVILAIARFKMVRLETRGGKPSVGDGGADAS